MKVTIWWAMYTVDAKGEDVETIYDIECDLTPYDPGKTWGDPETCYPPEGGDGEILSIKLQGIGDQPGIDINYNLWPLLGFKGKVLEEIIEKAFEEAPSKEDDDDPRGWEPGGDRD